MSVDVAFVGHAADRTGPPLALLRLLRGVRAQTDLDVELFLFRGGPLLSDFETLLPTTVVGEPAEAHDRSPITWARVTAQNIRLALVVPRLRRARLIYLNTSWTVRVLSYFGPGGPPVVAHVHELDLDIGDLLPPADLRRLQNRPDHYVVGTPVAAANLVEQHGVDPDRIILQPYFVAPPPPTTPRRPASVPENALVVGAAGVTVWRKSPDLFVQLASRVLEQTDRPVHFVWIGGVEGGPRDLGVPDDIKALGLDATVHFVGEQGDPYDWFAGFDLLVLGSREDTFPLVCLEAGSLGVPIVSFDQGGIPDLVRSCKGGAVVPHLDVPALADAVAQLVDDDDRRTAAGQRLAAHVQREHGVAAGADLAETVAGLVP